MLMYRGLYVDEDVTETEDEVEDESKNYYEHKKKKKNVQTEDLYELLGLGHLRWMATPEEIKSAYRKMALVHHPDKNPDKSDHMFKLVNKAWNTLNDPRKRKDYDSQDPFDDSLPDSASINNDSDFYVIYGGVFKLNSKWSLKQPVPTLGNETTPVREVEHFYYFWRNFSSWREFNYLNEYDPEDAESREERRWMERKNKALQDKKRKEEKNRINTLIDKAYSMDPRIRKLKEEQQKEREDRKKAYYAAIQRKKDEEEKKRLEEEQRKKEEQEREEALAQEKRKEHQKMKKQTKKLRQQVRAFCSRNNIGLSKSSAICEKFSFENLEKLCSNFDNDEAGIAAVDKMLEELEENERIAKEKRKEQERIANKKKPEAEWTPEELSLLTKAIIKYPVGTVNRWELIEIYMGHTKTQQEIITKQRSIKDKDLKEKVQTREWEDSFERFQKSRKNVTVESGHSVRYDGPIVTAEEPKKDTDPSKWEPNEHKLLENALKKYPSTTPNRWDVIASDIPGRSKSECIARFKYLVQMVKEKKGK